MESEKEGFEREGCVGRSAGRQVQGKVRFVRDRGERQRDRETERQRDRETER